MARSSTRAPPDLTSSSASVRRLRVSFQLVRSENILKETTKPNELLAALETSTAVGASDRAQSKALGEALQTAAPRGWQKDVPRGTADLPLASVGKPPAR